MLHMAVLWAEFIGGRKIGTEPDLLADTGEIRLRPYFRI